MNCDVKSKTKTAKDDSVKTDQHSVRTQGEEPRLIDVDIDSERDVVDRLIVGFVPAQVPPDEIVGVVINGGCVSLILKIKLFFFIVSLYTEINKSK